MRLYGIMDQHIGTSDEPEEDSMEEEHNKE
jgi:hypothetical protein